MREQKRFGIFTKHSLTFPVWMAELVLFSREFLLHKDAAIPLPASLCKDNCVYRQRNAYLLKLNNTFFLHNTMY